MPTMKDVARLAGVSHGTVSNVLNGSKGVSLDKIKRVEEAIRTLGYKPNALARNLKSSNTMRLDVVLPNSADPAYQKIFEAVERAAAASGYAVYLQTHDESPERERGILERALQYNSDGMILMTCQPDNAEFFHRMIEGGLPIVFVHRTVADAGLSYAGVDVRTPLQEDIACRLSDGAQRLAIVAGPKEYSFDSECVDSFFHALFRLKREILPGYVETIPYNGESAMRAAARLLNLESPPTLVYTTSAVFTEAITRTFDIMLGEKARRPRIVTLTAEDWKHSLKGVDILLPYGKLGEAAFELLESAMQGSAGGHVTVWGSEQSTIFKTAAEKSGSSGGRIRILLPALQTSESVRNLISDFQRRHGVEVEIAMRGYKDLLLEIRRGVLHNDYDVYAFDIAWMRELAKEGFMFPLDNLLVDKGRLKAAFGEQIADTYCCMDGIPYAMPYNHSAQMLFYRKDLFSQLKNKRMFHEQYHAELLPPEDWESYNAAARFFTRRFNRDSATVYGTALGGRAPYGACFEYLPRLFAYGGAVFTPEGQCSVADEAAVDALTNYAESFRYAHPEAANMWWEEQVVDFARGNTALMVMYTDHAAGVFDRAQSSVAGKVGVCMLPAGASALHGWSIAVNPHSRNRTAALDFLKWCSAEELAVPNAVMGRILPYKSLYENGELDSICPWREIAPEASMGARALEAPAKADGSVLSESIVDTILGDAVHQAIRGNSDIEAILKKTQKRIQKALG